MKQINREQAILGVRDWYRIVINFKKECSQEFSQRFVYPKALSFLKNGHLNHILIFSAYELKVFSNLNLVT